MAKNKPDLGKIKTIKVAIWIMFAGIVLSEILYRLIPSLVFGITEVAFAIALFVLSIKGIKMKSYGLSITMLVIASIVLLVFIIGFIGGVVQGLNAAAAA